MLAPSFSWRPVLFVSLALSLPARSTSDSLPVYTYSNTGMQSCAAVHLQEQLDDVHVRPW